MDLSNHTIKKLFEKQILELTKKSGTRTSEMSVTRPIHKEELFDFQLSGGWLR